MRVDNRSADVLRPVRMERNYLKNADGSVFIETGNTRVLCAATVSEKVPDWMSDKGSGWVTAEYGMLPASTSERRNGSRARRDSRSLEIQRLIGRCLRAVTDLKALGPRTVWIDCDVIDADGGTRTASVTGSYVALRDALDKLVAKGKLNKTPLIDEVAAVSVGIVNGEALLDLDYSEDSSAQVDMNVAMTGAGKFVEVQGTAEGMPFSYTEFNEMIEIARRGIEELLLFQRKCLE